MKKLLFILMLFTVFNSLNAQKIKIKVTGEKDTLVNLIRYFGKGLYYADTAMMKNGVVTFDGSKQKPGILGLLLSGQRYFEFVYNNEDIWMETSGPDFVKNMKVLKSEENNVFIPYVDYITKQKTQAGKLGEERAKYKMGDPQYKSLGDQIDLINKAVEEYQNNIMSQHKDKLVAKIVKMSTEVFIPEAPLDENGNIIDSSFRFNYYRKHYWDNVDLLDERLVNNPVFHNKLEYYFSKNLMLQHWDTVLVNAFDFCDRLNPKTKTFEYVVGWITSTYGKSQIMGMDKVYLMMLDRYYCSKNESGKSPAYWIAEDKLKDLCENLKNKVNLVLGARPPNLILKDTTDNKWVDLYAVDAEYTILYFWDPECGHCKKVTPMLEKLYNKKLKGRNIEVYAVGKAVGKDFEAWKKYIRDNNLTFVNVAVTDKLYELAKSNANSLVPVYPGETGKPTTLESLNYQTAYDIFSTPKVFVLDKDKKIIAKSLSLSQIEDMLDKLQGYPNIKKILKSESLESETNEKNDNDVNKDVTQEIVVKDQELSKELQDVINSQIKNEMYISPDVKLDINVKTEDVYLDGKKETNIHIEYLYEVVKLTAENKTDDFPAGSYDLGRSNAAMFIMNFIKKTLEGKLNQYLTPNREILIKIKGFTDASLISGDLIYKGEYGNFDNEPYFFNSDITSASLIKGKKISSNQELGFLRTVGVSNFIQNNIDVLKKCNLIFEHEVIVEKKIGSNYRKISVEIIINDAFSKTNPLPSNTNNSTQNKEIDFESLYLQCKKSVFMIEILGENNSGIIGAQGSGFIISSDGIGVSNFHVFEDMFWKTAIIHLDNGTKTTIEKIIYQDPLNDYIVFKLKNNQSEPFEKLNISDQLPNVASQVFTIGNPEGFDKSFSRGEISAYRLNYKWLQTTTPITHGSSGGPLINVLGEVVGITQGTFNQGSAVYDIKGKIIGYTENGGQGSLYKAISTLPLNLRKYIK